MRATPELSFVQPGKNELLTGISCNRFLCQGSKTDHEIKMRQIIEEKFFFGQIFSLNVVYPGICLKRLNK